MSVVIVLFRRDLRLADNPALYTACKAHARILPLYVYAPDEDGEWAPGAASRWWLHHALAALQNELHRHGGSLHLRRGNTLAILRTLIKDTGAAAVYWNRLYEPAAIARDTEIKAALRGDGVDVCSFNAALWHEPWQIETKQGGPYRVFTPYWRNVRPQLQADAPLPVPSSLHCVIRDDSEPLQSFDLLPRVRWDRGMAESWVPGAAGATEMLEVFADDALGHYAEGRDIPGAHGTSRLSPHLHFGEISPRQVHYFLIDVAKQSSPRRHLDIEPYLRELGWREFAHHLLYHFPDTPTNNFNPRFDGFSWAEQDEHLLQRWQRGRTGIPLVDAGMRELWHCGWMHNRVRMIVASFLTKNLRQHWIHGARWFWDTLVDADLANNTLGWQWVAGSGADAAPYFRIFNPVTQARRFDPQGTYLRRWLPELAAASTALLHEPWQDQSLLRASGYPAPMVELGQSRNDALSAYQQLDPRAT